MVRPSIVEVFCEDLRHEEMARALVERIARDEGLFVSVQLMSGTGGRGSALSEFATYQRRRKILPGVPALLVVMIDCDDKLWNERKNEVESTIDGAVFPQFVVACPDPHVERWYYADKETFTEVVGEEPPSYGTPKERLESVTKLTIRSGLELAKDIMDRADLHRAGRSCPSLRHAVRDLRSQVRQLVRWASEARGGNIP